MVFLRNGYANLFERSINRSLVPFGRSILQFFSITSNFLSLSSTRLRLSATWSLNIVCVFNICLSLLLSNLKVFPSCAIDFKADETSSSLASQAWQQLEFEILGSDSFLPKAATRLLTNQCAYQTNQLYQQAVKTVAHRDPKRDHTHQCPQYIGHG